MSRTPEKITDKKAVNTRNNIYIFAAILAFIAWIYFKNEAFGTGFTFALGSYVMFWAGGKIKTTFHKTHEIGGYTKR